MMVQGTFSALLAPGLNEVFHNAREEEPTMWGQLFSRNSSERAYEEDFHWAGFEQFQEFGELENIQLKDAEPGAMTRYVHRKWGQGYQLSRELMDDNLYGNVSEFPAMLARAAHATKETVASFVLNNGFSASFPGGDGKPLFSTAHPLYGTSGGTQANTFTTSTALSEASLKSALTSLRTSKDDASIFSPIMGPMTLWVPPALEFTALEILGTPTRTGGVAGDLTINPLQDRQIKVQVWNYLTDDNNWFLSSDSGRTKLKYFERWPLQQFMEDVNGNLSMRHYAYERYSFGWSSFYGIFGVQGA